MHHIFQRQGIPPDEFYAKPYKVRDFMLASTIVQLETELEAEDEQIKEIERRTGHGRA